MSYLAEDKEAFNEWIKKYADCGGRVNKTTQRFIHAKFKEHRVTPERANEALEKTFEKEQFMNFANVMKYLNPEYKVVDGGVW